MPDVANPISDRRAWPRIDAAFLKRRGTALVLTVLVHLIMLLLLLLTHGPQLVKKKEDDGLVTFSVMPEAERKHAGEKTKAKSLMADKAAVTPTPKPAESASPSVAPKPKDETPSFIQLSPSDFAATDIGKMAQHGAANGSGGSTGASRAVAGPGEGPGGARLLRAEWYREPTRAELDPYLPPRFLPPNPPAEGEADIACTPIEHYHVENCQVLWESPAGSGLGRALRQAAWQFLVRPERIEGGGATGQKVLIHFSFELTRQGDATP